MDPTPEPLDQIAELLQRWQGVDGPVERVRVITDATQALRGLSSVDTRVLAQGLWEHGAPAAAEQVAARTGAAVSADDAAEAAQAMLSLDRGEVRRLVEELGDTQQRRQLLINSGVPVAEVESLVPDRPAAAPGQGAPPPPPGANGADAAATPVAEAPGAPSSAQEAASSSAQDRAHSRGQSSVRSRTEAERAVNDISSAERPSWDKRAAAEVDQLMSSLREATSGRERLQSIDEAEHGDSMSGADLVKLLGAAPDGWQRRTILRKLVKAGRVGEVSEPADIVTAFNRSGDRFAAAAMLVRAGVADAASVSPALGRADAARLMRRAGN